MIYQKRQHYRDRNLISGGQGLEVQEGDDFKVIKVNCGGDGNVISTEHLAAFLDLSK